jgi:hypothetical protein
MGRHVAHSTLHAADTWENLTVNGEPCQTSIVLSPRRVVKILLAIMAFLLAARIATAWWHLDLGHDDRFGIMRQFNTNNEANAPTYFSDLILLFAAVLLALIAAAKRRMKDRFARHWAALSAVLLYMSVDEACQIHEYWGEYTSFLKGHLGLLNGFSWVVVGSVVALAVGLTFLRFLLSLPRQCKTTFLAAGFFYVVCGAIGGEVFSALTPILKGHHRLGYAVVETLEEFCEMSGIVILIWGLLTYMEAEGMSIIVQASHQLPRRARASEARYRGQITPRTLSRQPVSSHRRQTPSSPGRRPAP